MVSGLGSARGDSNHTERSHYFLKKHLLDSISVFTQHSRIHHIKHQPQGLQSPLKQNKIHYIIHRNDINAINIIKISFMWKIIN